jgi:hypothetical protein
VPQELKAEKRSPDTFHGLASDLSTVARASRPCGCESRCAYSSQPHHTSGRVLLFAIGTKPQAGLNRTACAVPLACPRNLRPRKGVLTPFTGHTSGRVPRWHSGATPSLLSRTALAAGFLYFVIGTKTRAGKHRTACAVPLACPSEKKSPDTFQPTQSHHSAITGGTPVPLRAAPIFLSAPSVRSL